MNEAELRQALFNNGRALLGVRYMRGVEALLPRDKTAFREKAQIGYSKRGGGYACQGS